MNFLKKFITANLYSIYGYGLFIHFLYLYIPMYITSGPYGHEAFILAILRYVVFSVLRLKYFIWTLLVEFTIIFILSKILKRKIGLNIQNKTYDFLFRLGIMFSFAPVIFVIVFFAKIPIGVIIPWPDNLIPYVLLITLVFYLLTKYVFFRKQK